MQSAISSPYTVRRSGPPREPAADSWLPNPKRPRGGLRLDRPHERLPHERLARYTDECGRLREVVRQRGVAGTVLVIDHDAATLGDGRLLAHLSADEPAENAALLCSHYLRDARARRLRCRAVSDADRSASPVSTWEQDLDGDPSSESLDGEPLDLDGDAYALRRVEGRTSIPQLRWCQRRSAAGGAAFEPVCLREAVASVERYEPLTTLTRRALARHERDAEVSTAVLRAELVRLQESPIVLNRRLREVVLAIVKREQLSMSEIAVRCGRIKRDSRGNESGETSWLARRLGLLCDSGNRAPTPWIHSDVLALIARRGLGVCPCEVEVR